MAAPAHGPDLAALAALSADAALRAFDSSAAGLPPAEAAARRRRWGANAAGEPRHDGWLRFLRQLASPLPLAMLALAALSYATGAGWQAALIGGIVLSSTLFSFVQERRSGRAAERLRAMVRTTVVLARPGAPDGQAEVAAADLVPGDVVHLAAGDTIPADLRVLSARDLFLDESTLTGEAMPAEKSGAPVEGAAGLAPLAIPNLAFAGCTY